MVMSVSWRLGPTNGYKFANYDSGFGANFDNYVGGKTGSSLQKFFDSSPLIARCSL
jgi:hypothetical protein